MGQRPRGDRRVALLRGTFAAADGISGAWIGQLTALEPYRPIFIGVTVSFVGLATTEAGFPSKLVAKP
jgi:MerT mercuric transport protein